MTRNSSETLKERGYLEEISVDGKISFDRFLSKQDGKTWIGFMWLRWRQVDAA
jgi:hypothetical protein